MYIMIPAYKFQFEQASKLFTTERKIIYAHSLKAFQILREMVKFFFVKE